MRQFYVLEYSGDHYYDLNGNKYSTGVIDNLAPGDVIGITCAKKYVESKTDFEINPKVEQEIKKDVGYLNSQKDRIYKLVAQSERMTDQKELKKIKYEIDSAFRCARWVDGRGFYGYDTSGDIMSILKDFKIDLGFDLSKKYPCVLKNDYSENDYEYIFLKIKSIMSDNKIHAEVIDHLRQIPKTSLRIGDIISLQTKNILFVPSDLNPHLNKFLCREYTNKVANTPIVTTWGGQILDPEIRQAIQTGDIVRVQTESINTETNEVNPDLSYMEIIHREGDILHGVIQSTYQLGERLSLGVREDQRDWWYTYPPIGTIMKIHSSSITEIPNWNCLEDQVNRSDQVKKLIHKYTTKPGQGYGITGFKSDLEFISI
jgi:hypothetical protein